MVEGDVNQAKKSFMGMVSDQSPAPSSNAVLLDLLKLDINHHAHSDLDGSIR